MGEVAREAAVMKRKVSVGPEALHPNQYSAPALMGTDTC
jgi:hypothetical protein